MSGPESMRAVYLTGTRELEVREVPVPEPGDGECLVAVGLFGLCGTDLGLYDGSSNYLRDGHKRYPFVPGHEWSGTVVRTGPGVHTLQAGDRVSGHNFRACGRCAACRGDRPAECTDHEEAGVLGAAPGVASDYAVVPEWATYRLPDAVGDEQAALLEPCSSSLHAVERAGVTGDDEVAVLGGGTLGLAAMQLARARGATVSMYTPTPETRELAAALGADRTAHPSEAEEGRYSVVIEASGATAAAAQAPRLCRPDGRYAQLGTPHEDVDGMPMSTVVMRNLTILGVISGLAHWPGLIDSVASGTLQLERLVAGVWPLADVADAFDELEKPRSVPKILVRMG